MNFEIEITDRISEEQHSFESLKIEKMSSMSISMERHFLLEMEKKEAYIKGMKEALSIMQKKID
jgi:hypothetical protein